jgi:hypothetical protein
MVDSAGEYQHAPVAAEVFSAGYGRRNQRSVDSKIVGLTLNPQTDANARS